MVTKETVELADAHEGLLEQAAAKAKEIDDRRKALDLARDDFDRWQKAARHELDTLRGKANAAGKAKAVILAEVPAEICEALTVAEGAARDVETALRRDRLELALARDRVAALKKAGGDRHALGPAERAVTEREIPVLRLEADLGKKAKKLAEARAEFNSVVAKIVGQAKRETRAGVNAR